MKTISVREAKPQLDKLVAKVQRGEPVILSNGHQLAKLERFIENGGPIDVDPDEDTPQLEALLLEAVNGPHRPYSTKEMEAILKKACKRARKK